MFTPYNNLYMLVYMIYQFFDIKVKCRIIYTVYMDFYGHSVILRSSYKPLCTLFVNKCGSVLPYCRNSSVKLTMQCPFFTHTVVMLPCIIFIGLYHRMYYILSVLLSNIGYVLCNLPIFSCTFYIMVYIFLYWCFSILILH